MEFNIISDNILKLKGDVLIQDTKNSAVPTEYENTVFISFPTKDIDDDENTKLESAYIKSILEATTYQNATINVPVIDNGYGEKVVYDTAREVIASIVDSNDSDDDSTTINLVLPLREYNPAEAAQGLKKFMSIPDFKQNAVPSTAYKARTSDGVILDLCDLNDTTTLKMENGDLYIPDSSFKNPYNFLEFALAEQGRKNNIFTRNGISKQKLDRLRNKDQALDRVTIFKMIFLMKLNLNQAIEFMTLCGITFSPLNKEEVIFANILKGKYKGEIFKDIYDINDFIFAQTGISIFFPEK